MFVVEKEPKSIAAETYKNLRTNIAYSSYNKNLTVLVVTSAKPQEGKSTVAGNLALSLVQDGKKVIIVDCDLRKPTIHKNFSLSNRTGVVELVLGMKSLSDSVIHDKSGLDILTCGKIPPNPAEMLGSQNMKDFLESIKQSYDYIILDAPPVLAVADAQILSIVADGVVFVVRAGKTTKEQVIQAKIELAKVDAPIIGTVLNAIDTSDSKNQYYYYYDNESNNTMVSRKKKGIFSLLQR